MKKILISLGIIVLAVAGWVVWSRTETSLDDAKNYVGNSVEECSRIQVMCIAGYERFDDEQGCGCRKVTDGSSGISGTVLLGPTCPVQREPPDPQCEDKPYSTSLVVTTVDGARVIASFTSDSNGSFRVAVPPGEYAIRSAAAANIRPYCSGGPVMVRASGYATTTVQCDTGIR
jgi:hypothetical protein